MYILNKYKGENEMDIGNNIKIHFQESWYNKTHVEEDGVTYSIDPTEYVMCRFELSKDYFDIEDEEEIVKAAIEDLKAAAAYLEELLEKNKEEEQEEEIEIEI
jgi:hypothetical protein